MLTEEALHNFISRALEEDIGTGDQTTLCCIPADRQGKAVLKIKEHGIMAGMAIAESIFRFLQPDCIFTAFKQDGEPTQDGETGFEITALSHTILTAERLVLNCMQRMSGIATLTRRYVEKLQPYHTRLLDTRKTTPNFRLLEKEAVRIGGGMNHRMGLYDMIMLKDNHIDYCGGIEKAIMAVTACLEKKRLSLPVEIETRSLDDVKKVLAIGKVQRIMLDNFTPEALAEAVQLINGRFETEASGGITLDNIAAYARSNVDYISVGALVHHAVSLDLSLKAAV